MTWCWSSIRFHRLSMQVMVKMFSCLCDRRDVVTSDLNWWCVWSVFLLVSNFDCILNRRFWFKCFSSPLSLSLVCWYSRWAWMCLLPSQQKNSCYFFDKTRDPSRLELRWPCLVRIDGMIAAMDIWIRIWNIKDGMIHCLPRLKLFLSPLPCLLIFQVNDSR